MEKLQAAIEKARERRAASTAAMAAEARNRPEPTPVMSDDQIAWDTINEVGTPANVARRNRLHFDGHEIEAGYYDRLRTKVLQQCRDNGWRRIAVTSATKGCGKTTTCANLAASFTRQRDRRMMLLDFDMRRPELARVLGHRTGAGFSDYLEGKVSFEEQAIRLSPRVIVCANQKSHPNPAEIILQDRTPELLDEIQARFQPDIMVFDTPPILANDDTMGMLKYVDCAIIVAAAETSTTKHVDECERELAEQTNVVGVILNKCKYMDEAQSYYY